MNFENFMLRVQALCCQNGLEEDGDRNKILKEIIKIMEFKQFENNKFHIEKQLFLLAYELEADVLKLIMIGSHEDYYRDLTKYCSE